MWVAVADCCLILKLSPIHGCRFKVFTIVACPVSVTPANRIIIASIRSHSGGPLGTRLTTHSWELNTQIIQCTPTLEDHLVLVLTIHSWDFCALASPASSPGPCWFLLSLLVARTVGPPDSTDYQFIRFIHVDHCRFF
jgi:hypothetical protein